MTEQNIPEPPTPPQRTQSGEQSSDDNAPVLQPDIDPAVVAEHLREDEHHRHRRRMSRDHVRRIKRKKRIRRALIALGVLVLILIALCAWLGVSALKAKSEMESAVAIASKIQSSVKSGDTNQVKADIEQFSQHIDATYAQTKQPVWALATLTPHYGSDVKAVREAVRILEDVSINALPKLAQSAEALDLNSIGVENGTIQLGNMAQAAQDLTAANEVIADANVSLSNISGTHIPQLTNALNKGTKAFNTLASLTDTVSRMADVMPKMLGLAQDSNNTARNYLVLAQNNSELRATGGIPASWGTLSVNQGKLSVGTFEAPSEQWMFSDEESKTTLTADERVLFSSKMATRYQDINFTPDFPRTAKLAEQVWQRAGHGDVDGVLSVDPVFLQRLLSVTGPVTLSDGTVLSADNAAQILLNQTYIDKATGREQDAFFTMAASEVFGHILTDMGGKNRQLVEVFQQSVTDGHLYVWSAHEDEQERLQDTAISGALTSNPSQPVTGVYFNDATMGKMDWYLKREVTSTYDKTYPSGAKQYTIHIKLTNTADAAQVNAAPDLLRGYDHEGNPRKGEIETIMYLYAPDEGRIVDWTQDFDQITMHNELTVGVKTVTLQPGESFETTVHVSVSPSAGDHEMTLRQTPLVD